MKDLMIKDHFSSHPTGKISAEKAMQLYLKLGTRLEKEITKAKSARRSAFAGVRTATSASRAYVVLDTTQKKALVKDSEKLNNKELVDKYKVSRNTVKNILRAG